MDSNTALTYEELVGGFKFSTIHVWNLSYLSEIKIMSVYTGEERIPPSLRIPAQDSSRPLLPKFCF